MNEGADAAVIELGSSDEETSQPPVKKLRPVANAMVCIPSVNLPKDITVKPTSKIVGINPLAKINAKPSPKVVTGSSHLTVQKLVPIKVNDPGNRDKRVPPKTVKALGRKIQNVPFTPLRISPSAKINNGPNVVSASDMAKAKQILMKVQNDFKRRAPQIHNQILRPVRPVCVVGSPVSLKTTGPSFPVGKPVLFAPKHKPYLGGGIPTVTPRVSNINAIMKNHTNQKNPTLPPGITVKRVAGLPGSQSVKRAAEMGPATLIKKKRKINPISAARVPLVELDDDDDDDDGPTSDPNPAAPQWYVHPNDADKPSERQEDPERREMDATMNKESKPVAEMQLKNNKEPELKEMIEITIEDSPIKPPPVPSVKMTSDLFIIIEDSPQKAKDDTEKKNHDIQISKSPKSKKSLNFPQSADLIEVEVEFAPVSNSLADGESRNNLMEDNLHPVKIYENRTSDAQVSDLNTEGPSRKKSSKDVLEKEMKRSKRTEKRSSDEPKITSPASTKTTLSVSDSSLADFNENYREFIQLCLEMENSEDMNKIVEKKVKEYYRQVDSNYTESDDFKKFVSSKVKDIRSTPHNLYLYIKDVVDELKLRRKSKTKSNEVRNETVMATEPVKEGTQKMDLSDIPQVEESVKGAEQTNRNIRKLEKTLRKLHRAIQKLEEQEVDFDDENDSAYLLTERYKERMVRVHAKLCQLTATKMPSEARVTIEVRSGRPQGPTARLEKFINKKVPVGAPLPFPDFHDVLKCVREANLEDKLGWSEPEIMEEARDLFARCGKRLQRRRQKHEWRLAASRLGDTRDPAELSPTLQDQLRRNKEVATVSENRVINKFADRQNTLQLEPKEIGDNDNEESAPSSDDEVQTVEDEIIPISSKKTFSPIKLQRGAISPAEAEKVETAPKETESKDDDNLITVTLEENESNSNEAMDVDTKVPKVAESESEQIKLIVSDENTANGVEYETKVRVNEGNVSEKDTDTDAPITLSDTQESDDNADKVEKCGFVSIEDSSTSNDESEQDQELDGDESGEEVDHVEQDTPNVISFGDDETRAKYSEVQQIDDDSLDATVEATDTLKSNDEISVKLVYESEETETAVVVTKSDEVITYDISNTLVNEMANLEQASAIQTDDVHLDLIGDTDSNPKNEEADVNAASSKSDAVSIKTVSDSASNPDEITSDEGIHRDLLNEETSGGNLNSDVLDIGPTIIQGMDILASGFEVSSHSDRSNKADVLSDEPNEISSRSPNADVIDVDNADCIERQTSSNVYTVSDNCIVHNSKESVETENIDPLVNDNNKETTDTENIDLSEEIQKDKVYFEETTKNGENYANDIIQEITNDTQSHGESNDAQDQVCHGNLNCSDETADILNEIETMVVDTV